MNNLISLEQIRIASPCHADWSSMQGDDRSRFCGECKKHVYNLSALRREEAEALVREKEGHLCVRYYQRRDGTVLTADCPVGVRVRRRRVLLQAGALVSILASLSVASASESVGGAKPASEVRGEPQIIQPVAPRSHQVRKTGAVKTVRRTAGQPGAQHVPPKPAVKQPPPLTGKPVAPPMLQGVPVIPPKPPQGQPAKMGEPVATPVKGAGLTGQGFLGGIGIAPRNPDALKEAPAPASPAQK